MRARNLLALAAIATACSSQGQEPVAVGVNASLVIPEDVFANMQLINLYAYDTSPSASPNASCDPTTGLVTGAPASQTYNVQLKPGAPGCTAKYCGQLSVNIGPTYVFLAQGLNGTGTGSSIIGTGCATQAITNAQTPLSITMLYAVPTSTCNGATVSTPTQCTSGVYCDATTCLSKEVALSNGATANGTKTGAAKTKTNPFFLWPSLSGANGQFLALFNDTTSGDGADIGVRALSDSWVASSSPLASAGEFFLPDGSSPPGAMAGNQSGAAAVFANSKYFVVFEDSYPSTADIHLRSMDTSFNADQTPNNAITINGANGAGEPGTQIAPSMAASTSGALFIAWQDSTGGPHANTIQGVLYNPSAKTYGSQQTISNETPSSAPTVATISSLGSSGGFVVAWQGASAAHYRFIDSTGTTQGGELSVTTSSYSALTQDHPSIASLPDGRFALAFIDHASNNVMIERYDATQALIAGDPVTVNNVNMAAETLSSIAGMTAVGGSYAVTWLDGGTSGNIRGRYVGGSGGFLQNSVDGQANEFLVSLLAGDTRTNPVVVSGGASGAVVFGWESTKTPGIVGRYFPAPTQ